MQAIAWHDGLVDDRELVAATLDGDRGAFARLVERETGAVYRTCLRIVGQPQDAEDVTQETFVNAFRALGSYRGDGPLRAWLLRIATRQSFRRLSQRRTAAPLDAVTEERVADADADPAGSVVAAERDDSLRRAVTRLPDRYREVVALRFFADLSLAEIAEATGRPLNTVKTHLRRGLEALRPIVGELAQEREVSA
jgi:RNA polymerase sigma-70 factor (ECF subfamily)